MSEAGKTAGSELHLRIVFGLLLAALAFFQTWLGGTVFQIFIAIVAIVMFFEYKKICASALPIRIAFVAFAFLILNMIAWVNRAYDSALILALFAILSLWAWEAVIRRSGWGALGLVYTLAPFFALVHLRGTSIEGFHVLLLLFGCVWGADTLAYFTGKAIGGPKLAPKISPGKTWSGFFGGLLGGVLIGWIVMKTSGYHPKPIFFGVAALLVLASQVGDLAESALKRRFVVKDSGTLIPGHGGVLDRIDGLVFASVIAWVMAMAYSGMFSGLWNHEPAIDFLSAIAMR